MRSGTPARDQVARGGAPAFVEEAGRHPGGRAGGAPGRAPAPDGDAVAVEDERAVGVASGAPPRQSLSDGGREGEDAAHSRLRARRREPDHAAGPIDLLPGQEEDLILAPAGVVGDIKNVPATGRATGRARRDTQGARRSPGGGDSRGAGRRSRARS